MLSAKLWELTSLASVSIWRFKATTFFFFPALLFELFDKTLLIGSSKANILPSYKRKQKMFQDNKLLLSI